jgi:hypothetical protein
MVGIRRRPGGRLPYARDPITGRPDKPNKIGQAYQDFEEHGIPIPDKFLSEAEREDRASRLAPMPREVKRPKPLISR